MEKQWTCRELMMIMSLKSNYTKRAGLLQNLNKGIDDQKKKILTAELMGVLIGVGLNVYTYTLKIRK
jgi:hypothetical protein